MRALSVSELLDLWDRGAAQAPVVRALHLLSAACPDMSTGDLAALSIGQRDHQLLTLREWTFGSDVSSLTTCGNCGATVELAFQTSDVRSDRTAPAQASLAISGYELTFRPPTSADLIAVTESSQLFERCLIEARRQGEPVPADGLPEAVVTAVADRLAEEDPQADVKLAIRCLSCDEASTVPFDIANFFWIEIDAWARRIVREVHTLARAYGWAERDILALSGRRRSLYLEMAMA